MTTPARGLIEAVRAAGGSIRVDGDRLRARPPVFGWEEPLVQVLRRHREEILRELQREPESPREPETAVDEALAHIRALASLGIELGELDHFYERAAIIEFGAKSARAEAEAQAVREALDLGRRRRNGGDA